MKNKVRIALVTGILPFALRYFTLAPKSGSSILLGLILICSIKWVHLLLRKILKLETEDYDGCLALLVVLVYYVGIGVYAGFQHGILEGGRNIWRCLLLWIMIFIGYMKVRTRMKRKKCRIVTKLEASDSIFRGQCDLVVVGKDPKKDIRCSDDFIEFYGTYDFFCAGRR